MGYRESSLWQTLYCTRNQCGCSITRLLSGGATTVNGLKTLNNIAFSQISQAPKVKNFDQCVVGPCYQEARKSTQRISIC